VSVTGDPDGMRDVVVGGDVVEVMTGELRL
jgi:hypothetical protein